MSAQIPAFFKEVVKDKAIISVQAFGGYLDNTMTTGDTQGATVKFPVVGRTEVYRLTGAIEPVPTGGPGMSTVTLTFDDFEASEFWRVQDAYKAGPAEQAALSDILVKAVRRKRDLIKLDALAAFSASAPVVTIGTGVETPDLLQFERGAAEIFATGTDSDYVFVGIPSMWAAQLAFYREFSNKDWTSVDDAPFGLKQRRKMRTVRNICYIELPDEYFTGPNGTSFYAYMWAKEGVGAEIAWNAENVTMTQQTQLQGSPWLMKTGMGGAAVGIQDKLVKRLWLNKIAAPVRPAV